MSGAERREVILAAARSEFARHGFHGASTARIAAASGCSEPMLYKHFAHKLDLFVATLYGVQVELESGVVLLFQQDTDPMQLWIDNLESILTDPLYAEMVQLRSLAITVEAPEIKQILNEACERHVERTRRICERSVACGSLSADVDPEYVAWMWQGIVNTAIYRHRIDGDGFANMVPHARRFLTDLQRVNR